MTREIPILDSCDVLVCGGGFGGISAALAAARLGKRGILLEKQYVLGGLGTAGLITYYLPLCDGVGHQVSFGLAEELLRLSISMGAEDEYPANWLDRTDPAGRTEKDHRFRVRYNPWLFAILAEQELIKAGVKILYGCYAVDTETGENRIHSVIVESISGRQKIRTRTVVDATGDACIAHLASAPTETHQQGNILAAWYYSLGSEGYRLNMLGFSDVPAEEDAGRTARPLLDRRFGGLDCGEVSEMMQYSHASTLNDIRKKRRSDPSWVPTAIATMPQLRMTRRIQGEYTLDDGEMHRYFADSVGMVSDWRKRGPIYEEEPDYGGTVYLRDGRHVGHHAGDPLLRRHRSGRRNCGCPDGGFFRNGYWPATADAEEWRRSPPRAGIGHGKIISESKNYN